MPNYRIGDGRRKLCGKCGQQLTYCRRGMQKGKFKCHFCGTYVTCRKARNWKQQELNFDRGTDGQ